MKRGTGAGVLLLVTAGAGVGVIVGCAKGVDSGQAAEEVNLDSNPQRAPEPEGGAASLVPLPPVEAGAPTTTCVALRADCNHDVADGCETDLGSDVSNCAACGSVCPKPANASATCALGTCGYTCSSGFSKLGPQCASFGGAYAVSDPGCTSCASANSIGGACGCPAGFGVITTARLINDCSGLHGALMTFCSAPGVAAGADWAGAFELDDAVAGGLGCRAPNPYTSACTCPSGATPIALRTLVDNSSTGALLGANLTVCLNQAAPTTTFAGAYQKDDAVAGGLGCRVANPKTAACSCPAGTTARDYRTVADVPGAKVGSMISLCVP
jgi:hypothetical protein